MNLKIQNLKLFFGQKKIFENINIELNPGDLLIVKGRNGSGKTSFLKSISGFFSFEESENLTNIYYENLNNISLSGSVLCSDLSIHENQEKYYYTRSFIPSNFEFYEEFDVDFYLRFWDKMNDELHNNNSKYNSVVNYFNFNDFLSCEVSELSSGWKKKLQYSRLLFENRPIWILDEPLNFLDNDGKNLIMNMINAKILSDGIVILSDHIGDIEKHINFERGQIKYINLS